MSVAQRVTEEEYQQIVLAEPERKWELVEGRLREKPGMTVSHNRVVMLLNRQLLLQLDLRQFSVFGEGRVRRSAGNIFMPDLAVIPIDFVREIDDQPGALAIFSEPLPLVVEVWSLSTGDYDVNTKVPEYQQRGDLEIWRIHPHERTLTAWRRQPDGSYVETVYREGVVRSIALPAVAIDLAELFAE